MAATINVTGECTLVDAVAAANSDAATGGCPAGSGADILVLDAGSMHFLGRNDYTYGFSGLLVSSEIVIMGNGSTIAASNNGFDPVRVMAVDNLGHLTLQDATITGGSLPSGDDGVGFMGGGILNVGGAVVLEGCTVSGNSGDHDSRGAGIANYARFGQAAVMRLSNSTVSGNVLNSIKNPSL